MSRELPPNELELWLVRSIAAAFPLRGEPQPLSADLIPAGIWEPLIECALKHSLASLLYASFSDLAQSSIPPAAYAQLEEAYYRTKYANAGSHRALAEILDAFDAGHVPVLVLKGAALSLWLYPNPALRPFGDLDLLIPRAALDAARALLEKQELRLAMERGEDFSADYLKGMNFTRGGAQPVSLDLHWHLFSPTYYQRTIPVEWFWERTTTFPVNGRTAATLNPEAQLLYLSAHAALHHTRTRLVLLYDIARLIAQHGKALDWTRITSDAAQLGLAPALALTLRRTVKWWSADVPETVLHTLDTVKPGVTERTMFALATTPQNAARSLADGVYQPGIGRKFKYALRFVFPSYEFMQTRYNVSHRVSLPYYYSRRGVHILALVTQSLLATARSTFRS